jgi:hypothetical protein
VYYIEFYERRPDASLDRFHSITRSSFAEWSRRHPEDELVANIGRTWRMGPYPYLLVWGCSGFERLAEWDATFRSGTVADIEDPILEVLTTPAAGFYRDVGPPLPRPAGGPFFLETFVPWDGAAERFARRADAAGVALTLVVARIGLLGPDPGGLALFSLSSLADIGRLADDVPDQVRDAGCYAVVGEEIL